MRDSPCRRLVLIFDIMAVPHDESSFWNALFAASGSSL
jgi:hypothetical protein